MQSHFMIVFLNSTQVYLLEPMTNVSDINLVVQFYHALILNAAFFSLLVVQSLSLLCLCPAASSAAPSCKSSRLSVDRVPFFCFAHAKGNGCHFSPSKDREIDDGWWWRKGVSQKRMGGKWDALGWKRREGGKKVNTRSTSLIALLPLFLLTDRRLRV